VDGNIVANAHEVALPGILDDKILICDAAGHRAWLDVACPTGQSGGTLQAIVHILDLELPGTDLNLSPPNAVLPGQISNLSPPNDPLQREYIFSSH
jgi:hypothetical protein